MTATFQFIAQEKFTNSFIFIYIYMYINIHIYMYISWLFAEVLKSGAADMSALSHSRSGCCDTQQTHVPRTVYFFINLTSTCYRDLQPLSVHTEQYYTQNRRWISVITSSPHRDEQRMLRKEQKLKNKGVLNPSN